jgi:hypothetical protein
VVSSSVVAVAITGERHQDNFKMVNPPLESGVGYGIVLGLGFAFALGMVSLIAHAAHLPYNTATLPEL